MNDTFIINALRTDARTSLAKLSRKHKVPATSIYYRLSLIEKEAILRYVSLVDFEILGYKRYLFVITGKKYDSEFHSYLKNHKNVNNLLLSTGGFLLEGIFCDLKELDEFVSNLHGQEVKFEYHPVLEIVKQESFQIS